MATLAELAAMQRAIALSATGIGTTSPNPPVGCVVLDVRGRIVGEGYHQRKGEAHAEVQALAAAGADAAGGTAAVTLEPCNHHGRTPPCRQALIDAGISRVLIAAIDPTSRGEGGAAALRAAGIAVETDVLRDEAQVVLGPWLTSQEVGRPEITWPYLLTSEKTWRDPSLLLASWTACSRTLLKPHRRTGACGWPEVARVATRLRNHQRSKNQRASQDRGTQVRVVT
jgi:diaminohydroxyphosphoribosylaminopyrimidine deaminase / 5-amino-6-(5-phosphoribosylamino)uracil reductase